MKNVWRLLLALTLILPFAGGPASADITEARAVMQRALDKLETFGYRLPDGGQDSAWFVWNGNPGYYKCIDRTFFRGNSYALVATGDSRVVDVDVRVYDENMNLIASDTDNSAVAVVQFSPRWTGLFHVRTTYYRGAPVGSLGFFVGYK